MVWLDHRSTSLEWSSELPPLSDIVHAVQECRKGRDVENGKYIYVHLCNYGLEAQAGLGNHVVPMFFDCGDLQHARKSFNKLVHRNEHTWTSAIQDCLGRGEMESALSLYHDMQDDLVQPSEYTFVPLLKACYHLNCIESGKRLYAELVMRGYEADIVVGNTLIDMYAKCGMISEAYEVFDRLPCKDIFSWNILLAAYAELGLSDEVLWLYEHMQLENLMPDGLTFICSLKACSKGAIDTGQEIHARLIEEGYEDCAFVVSKLMDVYMQCGMLEEAQEVFNDLPTKDPVVWTTLITGYAELGTAEEALLWFGQMLLAGVYADDVTLVCVLKACGKIGAILKGCEIHAQIVKQDNGHDPFVGNTLVCMYARCGWLPESRKVFDELQEKNVVSWTALIAGYDECGHGKEALHCFECMQSEGLSPNAATYISVLHDYVNKGTINEGEGIVIEIFKRGFEMDVGVCNVVLEFYTNFRSLKEAQSVFDTCGAHDVSSWNVLIAGYAQQGLCEAVKACWEDMQRGLVSANGVTYLCCLNFCAREHHVWMGQMLCSDILQKGLEKELGVGSALMEFFAKSGSLAELKAMFSRLPTRDVVIWNSFIKGFVEHGLNKEALGILEEMHVEGILPDVASWNMIILGFLQQGENSKALELYLRMQTNGLLPDDVILISILKACGEMGALKYGKRLHAQCCLMVKPTVELSNAILDMYGRCGSMCCAQEVFDLDPSWTLVKWNVLLAGYARKGCSDHVFHFFQRLADQNVAPDEITFLTLFTACSHAGLLCRCHEYLQIMANNYKVYPSNKHYTCMIDLFGRADRLGEAMAIMEMMASCLDLVMWDVVLSSCQYGGRMELGRQVLDSMLDQSDPAALILVSNMFARP